MGKGGKREGAGRKAGSSNAINKLLKEAIIEAAEAVGDGNRKKGLVAYLTARAEDQPAAYLALLGKLLPTTMAGDPENPIKVEHEVKPADKLRDMVIQVAERSGEAGRIATH